MAQTGSLRCRRLAIGVPGLRTYTAPRPAPLSPWAGETVALVVGGGERILKSR